MFIALATGGRTFDSKSYVDEVMDRLHAKHAFDGVVQGGAYGADTRVFEWCKKHGVQPITMDACWDFYDHGAGMIRNHKMIQLVTVDLIIAFPGNTGTSGMMMKAADQEIKIVDTTDLMGY